MRTGIAGNHGAVSSRPVSSRWLSRSRAAVAALRRPRRENGLPAAGRSLGGHCRDRHQSGGPPTRQPVLRGQERTQVFRGRAGPGADYRIGDRALRHGDRGRGQRLRGARLRRMALRLGKAGARHSPPEEDGRGSQGPRAGACQPEWGDTVGRCRVGNRRGSGHGEVGVRRRAGAAGEPGNNSAVAAIANPSLYPAREKRVDLLRWRRIPGGLRYLRRCGVMATVSRILPSLQTYRVWVRSYDKLVPQDAVEITEHIRHMTARPLISVLMPVATHDLSSLKQTIDGIVGQLYPKWELCMGVEPAGFAVAAKIAATYGDRRIKLAQSDSGAGFADTANAALALAEGRLVGLVQVGDELACYALYVVALEAEKHPDAVLLYSDEDAIGPRGRRFRPPFNGDWNPDLGRGCDMIVRVAVYRRTLVEAVGGFRPGLAGAGEYG